MDHIVKPHCYIRDADREIIGMTLGATQEEANQVAADFKEILDAPLVILGMVEDLRDDNERLRVQWAVIHEGERKLMTAAEIEDIMGAMPFVG